MYTTLSGQIAAYKSIEVIANNLANMTTTGFKAEKLIFEKALTQQGSAQGSLRDEISEPNRLKTDEFTRIKGTFTDFSQGAVKKSANPLDVAINGEGLFVVLTPDGERYTRTGEFSLDATGRLVTYGGHAVQGTGGDIVIGSGQAKIENDGSVVVDGQIVNQIRLVKPTEETQLLREAQQLFRLPEGGAIEEVPNVQVMGGALELSNVNAVLELTHMIMASRTYEAMEQAKESSSRMSRARNEVFNGAS